MKTISKVSQDPRVSVVVPVYNVAPYLEQCLNSLRIQTLKEIEIIVIDDGSTDESGEICDMFAEKDSRFMVIHKSNEGLSAARNDGLKVARSKYIMFVDSDDWVEPEFCEAPYHVAEESRSDVVVFQSVRFGSGLFRTKSTMSFPDEGIVSKAKVMSHLWQQIGITVWNKLYRNSLFEGIEFPVGHLCEDVAVTHHLIHNAERIYLLNKCLYCYRYYRPGSISRNNRVEYTEDSAFFHLRRIEELKQWGYDVAGEEIRIALWYLAVIGRDTELSQHFDMVIREAGLRGFHRSELNWKYNALFMAYRLSPRLFDLIPILSGKRIAESD